MSGEFDDDIRASMVAAKKPKPKSTAPREPFEEPDTINTPQREQQLLDFLGALKKSQKQQPKGRMRDEYVGPRKFDSGEPDYEDPGLEEMMNVLMSQSDNAPWYSHMQDM